MHSSRVGVRDELVDLVEHRLVKGQLARPRPRRAVRCQRINARTTRAPVRCAPSSMRARYGRQRKFASPKNPTSSRGSAGAGAVTGGRGSSPCRTRTSTLRATCTTPRARKAAVIGARVLASRSRSRPRCGRSLRPFRANARARSRLHCRCRVATFPRSSSSSDARRSCGSSASAATSRASSSPSSST